MAQDRRVDAYGTATALDQAQLDETFRGNENDINTIAELIKTLPEVTVEVNQVHGSPGVWTRNNHGLDEGQYIEFVTAPGVPRYVRNPTANSFNLSSTPTGVLIDAVGSAPLDIVYSRLVTLRFSDRPKYVGGTYYHGRASFPDIKRTIGELVAPSIQFSEMAIELNNVDGFYNRYLVGGDAYFSFIGARLVVKVGLRDTAGTYFTMFDGFVPDEEGFNVEREQITIRARDKADALNRGTGLPTINLTDFPSAPQESLGKIIPMALGEWDVGYNVDAETGSIKVENGGIHYDVITDAPSNFYGGLKGYPVGGGYFVFSIGTYTPDTITAVHVKRGNNIIPVTFNPNAVNTAGYWSVEVASYMKVGGGTLPYLPQDGDIAMIGVKIPYAPGKYNNPIELAEQILMTLGDVQAGDFDSASWTALKTKSSPVQSAMTTTKMRVWIGEDDDKILEYTLQHLEQVRVEMYWDRNQKVALRSMHPEDFPSQGSFRFEQIYLDEESLKVDADQRNFFNRALANYAFTPILGKTQLQTPTRKNQNSIDKSGKDVLKAVDLPSLYVDTDAQNQLDEFVRFYSTGHEYVTVNAAWPTLLRDLGEIIMLVYRVGSIDYDARPMKIRDIVFKPSNGSFSFKLLGFANFPYTGNAPANAAQMLSSQGQAIDNA